MNSNDIYDAFNQKTSAVSEISRSDNGRLESIKFNSKSETVEFGGDTYEANEIINQLRNGDQFEEVDFQSFVRKTSLESENAVSTALVVSGYGAGLLFPVVGVVMSIVLFAKGSVKHGSGVLATSLGAWVLWTAMFL